MKKNIYCLAVLVLLVALVGGCSSAKVLTNPDAQFPLPINDKTPAFLFPVNLSHAGSSGDPLAMGIVVTGGIASKFGKTVISGQQLFDLVGNLSWELAERIDSEARSGRWVMTGPAEAVASNMSKIMESVLAKLAELKLMEAGYKFRYIIAVHSHGSKNKLGMLAINSWGGIYDVHTKKIVSYINTTNNVLDDASGKAVLAQLPGIYNGIIEKLIGGK